MRRQFIRGTVVSAVAAAIGTPAVAQDRKAPIPKNPRADERDVIAQMAEAGYKDFILLSKKNAKLYIIKNSDFFLSTDILYGRGTGRNNRTPSGIFSLTNTFQGATKPQMAFHLDDTGVYLIHGVVRGREGAFLKDNMNARQLSDGCINVPDGILPMVSDFARQKSMEDEDHMATPFVIMQEKHNPRAFAKVAAQFKAEPYNFDKY